MLGTLAGTAVHVFGCDYIYDIKDLAGKTGQESFTLMT